MATTKSIDTATVVGKYLSRNVVTSSESGTPDSAEEVQALLEAAAITFLLYPQVALVLFLRAKNVLQQLVSSEITILDNLLSALDDLLNPDVPISDTSDLVEAQTALIELNKRKTVQAGLQPYERYQSAVNRFLDQQLAPSLKRNRRVRNGVRELERSGPEARQDLLGALGLLQAVHPEVATRLAEVQTAVDDFNTVDLTRLVSEATLGRVRSSLQQILSGFSAGTLSKMVGAIELLAGAASLKSISKQRNVYDSDVDPSRNLPEGRAITMDAPLVAATALSGAGVFNLGAAPWNFSVGVDGDTPTPLEIPATGKSGKVFLLGSSGTGTYNIPATYTLYLRINEGLTITDYAIALPTGGAVTMAAVVTAVNTAISAKATMQVFFTGSHRLLIVGLSPTTKITAVADPLGLPPTGTPGVTDYVPVDPPPSANTILGFTDNQVSRPLGMLTAGDLLDLLTARQTDVTFSVEADNLRITSNSSEPSSSLVFDTSSVNGVLDVVGTYLSEPPYLQLMENGLPLDPASVNVFVGSQVRVGEIGLAGRALVNPITSILGTQLYFDVPLPRGTGLVPIIISPLVLLVQALLYTLLPRKGSLDGDLLAVQKIASPLLCLPTLSQIGDARRVFSALRLKLTNPPSSGLLEALQAVVIREDQLAVGKTTETLLSSLEERGLDWGVELLQRAKFSSFFAVTKEGAARSSRFMLAIEQVGRTDLAQSTLEEDLPQGNVLQGSNPDTTLAEKING